MAGGGSLQHVLTALTKDARVRWQEATIITTLRSCVIICLPLLLGRFVYAMQCLR